MRAGRSQREGAPAKRTRPSLLVMVAALATVAQGLEAWPAAVRAVLEVAALGLWSLVVIRRV